MKKIKKLFSLLAALIFALSVSGCQSPNFVSGDKEASKINAAIIEALNAKDKDGIKALLCEYTLEIDNIDEQIDCMFDFFDESIFPIEKNDIWDHKASSEESSWRDGVKTMRIDARIEIQPEGEKRYDVLIAAYILCPSDPSRVGVSQIWVTDLTDIPNDIQEIRNAYDDNDRNCYVGTLIK